MSKPMTKEESRLLSELKWSKYYCDNLKRETRKYVKRAINKLRRKKEREDIWN